MPVPTTLKNLWIAASDGDLQRVKTLIEDHGMSPNQPDENTYTPMHAAASYGHLELLDYLISKGGDVNVADSDGDTPLYVAENIDVARYLIEHGAQVDRKNDEGISPAEHVQEDFPEVAAFLQTFSVVAASTGVTTTVETAETAEHLLNDDHPTPLSREIQEIMTRSELDGTDPESELRETLLRGVGLGKPSS